MKKALGVLFFLSSFFVLAHSVHALQVSPPKEHYSADPGQVIQDKILLIGTESKLTKVHLITQEFKKEGEENDRRFFDPEPGANTVGNWIKIKANLDQEISYGQVIEIPFEIVVPQNAPPGGHYGTITAVLSENKDEGQPQVGVESHVVSQMLLTVSGEVNEKLVLESFGTENNRWLFPHLPMKFITRINNQGNVHVTPKGFVEVFFFGKKMATLPVNEKNLETFPQSIRKYEQPWEGAEPFLLGKNAMGTFFSHVIYEVKHPQIGLFEARLGAVYGPQKNIFLQDSVKFIIFPWHAVLFFIALVVLYISAKKLWRKLTKKKDKDNKEKES